MLEILEGIKVVSKGLVTFSFPKMGNEQSQTSKDESDLAELADRVMQESKNKGRVLHGRTKVRFLKKCTPLMRI